MAGYTSSGTPSGYAYLARDRNDVDLPATGWKLPPYGYYRNAVDPTSAFSSHGVLSGLGNDGVSDTEFISDVKNRLSHLMAEAQAIGPKGIFEFGETYYEKWQPIQGELQQILADTKERYPIGSPERTTIAEGVDQVNNAVLHVMNEKTDDAFKAVLGVLTNNPIMLIEVAATETKSLERGAEDAATSANEVIVQPVEAAATAVGKAAAGPFVWVYEHWKGLAVVGLLGAGFVAYRKAKRIVS